MTISLAFLAPDLVKAAIDVRLPHGMGVARLADLSAEWSHQRQMLGLPGPPRSHPLGEISRLLPNGPELAGSAVSVPVRRCCDGAGRPIGH